MARRTTTSTARRPPPDYSTSPAEATLVQISKRYRLRAEGAQRARRPQNQENWHLYNMRQDWTGKQDWQSRLFLPDYPVAIDQIVNTLKRGLTDADDWLIADVPGLGEGPITDAVVKHLLVFYLDRLHVAGNKPDSTRSLASAVGEALMHGIHESVLTAKVYAVEQMIRRTVIEPANPLLEVDHVLYEFGGRQLRAVTDKRVRLAIDIVPFESYLPDPSPARRFEIHRVRRTLGELQANPDYDPDVIAVLYQRAAERAEDRADRRAREAEPGEDQDDPWIVTLDEYWGDGVDETTGTLVERNALWTLCDDLPLRKPVGNPFWHGRSCLVSTPLLGLRDAATRPALADRAAPITVGRNELSSLMLDGAFGEVWGTRQCRPDLLEDDSDIQNGIPQGYTAKLRPNVPQGLKFMERVDSGSIPQLALEVKRDLDASFQAALATPDTKLGALPPRQVKATEIVEANQASGSFLDALAATAEDEFLEPIFELAWQVILQYIVDWREPELIQVLGPELVLRMQDLNAAERFQLLRDVRFRVRGLRGVAAKQRTFTKVTTLLQTLSVNPALAQLFDDTMAIAPMLEDLVRGAGLDPARYRRPRDPAATGPPRFNAALALPGGSPPGELTAAADQRTSEAGFAPSQPGGVPPG